MEFGKGVHPSRWVGSYVSVGLCMQLEENLHMQAREPGGQERVFLAKQRIGLILFFSGRKQPPKEVIIGSFIHGGLIDQRGFQIRMSESYQKSQLDVQEARNNFHLVPKKKRKKGPLSECEIEKNR